MRFWPHFSPRQSGVILIEAALALAILAIFVAAIGTNLFQGITSARDAGERGRAVAYAEEGLEAVRNLRDAGLCCNTSGTFSLTLASNRWAFATSTSDTFDIFSRTITIDVPTATTSRVTSTVTWQQTNRGTTTVRLATELTTWQQQSAHGGMLVFGDKSSSADTIRYRLFQSDGTWGSVQTVPSLGVPLNRDLKVLRLYGSPSTNKKVLIAKFALSGSGDDQYIFAAVWNGSSWGSVVRLVSWPGTTRPSDRNFDGDYLANGNFLAVYNDETTIPKSAVWNGSSWTTGTPTLDIGGNPEWVVVKHRPNTSEAMVAIEDVNNDTNTLYWNGSSWTNLTEHGIAGAGPQYETVSFAWSPFSPSVGALMFNEASDNLPNIRIWNSTAWGLNIENYNIGNVVRSVAIDAHPNANQFFGCIKDSANDISCLTSDNTPLWLGAIPTKIATFSDSGTQRSFDVAYEGKNGAKALVVYTNGSTAAAQAIPKYRTLDSSTQIFSSEQSLTDLGGSAASLETVQLVSQPNSDDIMVLLGASNQTLLTQVWDGSAHAFSTSGGEALTLHGSAGSADEDQWYDFSWDP